MNPSYWNQHGYPNEDTFQNNIEKNVHVHFFVRQSVVRVIIGKGGSMIKKIEEQFDVKLFVENRGDVQTFIGLYGYEDGVQNATETLMNLLLSLPIIRTQLNDMGKPAILRYVEELTFLTLPTQGAPDWFINLEQNRIQLENEATMPRQTDTEKSRLEVASRGRPMLRSTPIENKPKTKKAAKSKSKAPPCTFKVKVVPKTESGLPDDRYETEAIALSVRTPTTYAFMVGALRAGVENLPKYFSLFLKIDGDWMKIPRPENNRNDYEIWDEYLVNQPQASRVLYLVQMPKVKKIKPEQEKSETLAQKNTKTEAERRDDQLLKALMKKDGLQQDLKLTQTLYERQKRNNENLEQQLRNLKFELETVKEKFSRELTGQERQKLEQLEQNNRLLKEIIQCTVCYTLKEKVVFCGSCGHFTCCVECARSMTQFECPTCRARWSADLDGRMGKSTTIFQDLVRFENCSKAAPSPRTLAPRTLQYPLNQTEAWRDFRFLQKVSQEAQSHSTPILCRSMDFSSDLAPTPISASQVSPPGPLRRSVTKPSNETPPLPSREDFKIIERF